MSLYLRPLLIVLSVFAADQASKNWLYSVFNLPGWCAENGVRPCSYEVTSFFNLVVGWNTGISFGLLQSNETMNRIVISLLVVGVCTGLMIWYGRTTIRLLHWAIPLVIGGALGNLVDRLRFGAVFDFLDFHFWGWHWYTFNVADSAIVIGVMLIAWDGLFSGDETAKQG